MAKNDSFPKTVVLSMDECKAVYSALLNLRQVRERAAKKAVADGLDVGSVYADQIAVINGLLGKF